MREADMNRSPFVYRKRLMDVMDVVAFAEIIARNKKELRNLTIIVTILEKNSEKIEVRMNEERIKYMEWRNDDFQKSNVFSITINKGTEYRN